MAYELPNHGETNWDAKIDPSLDYLKTTAEGAITAAAGAQGTADTALTAASTAAKKASNLSDLTSVTTARANLGLGTAAVADASTFDAAGAAATAQTAAIAAAVQRSNHTGTQSADTITDGTTNKAYTGTEKTKLSGIQALATANSSDATLLSRTNHTGSQAQSTVTNLVSDLAAKAPTASPTFTGTVSGVTAAMVGLGNVTNTSDASKPVSTAQQAALDGKVTGNGSITADWGVRPRLYYNGTTWPSRNVPSGYSGSVEWVSWGYPGISNPVAALDGDIWYFEDTA